MAAGASAHVPCPQARTDRGTSPQALLQHQGQSCEVSNALAGFVAGRLHPQAALLGTCSLNKPIGSSLFLQASCASWHAMARAWAAVALPPPSMAPTQVQLLKRVMPLPPSLCCSRSEAGTPATTQARTPMCHLTRLLTRLPPLP